MKQTMTTDEARTTLRHLLAQNTEEATAIAHDLCLEYDLPHPYRITGPAKISFSGGRTSAYMLRKILDAHGGQLPDDVHVLFANTGKELDETLDFVHACSQRWGVPVHWIERDPDSETGYREVTYETAARAGEPFQRLIEDRNYLPNPVTRFCTQELKIRAMKAWMMDHGYEHWTNVIGLRHDEPRRVTRIRSSTEKDRWGIDLPLDDAGVVVADIDAYWKASPFDLGLKKWEGNCDICFLKGKAKRMRIMRDTPSAAHWWIAQEVTVRTPKTDRVKTPVDTFAKKAESTLMLPMEYGEPTFTEPTKPYARTQPFRIDTPRYAVLFELSQQPMLDFDPAELDGEAVDDIGDCFCNAA